MEKKMKNVSVFSGWPHATDAVLHCLLCILKMSGGTWKKRMNLMCNNVHYATFIVNCILKRFITLPHNNCTLFFGFSSFNLGHVLFIYFGNIHLKYFLPYFVFFSIIKDNKHQFHFELHVWCSVCVMCLLMFK